MKQSRSGPRAVRLKRFCFFRSVAFRAHSPDLFEAAFRRCRDLDACLHDQLQAFANEVRKLAPAFAASVDALITRLQASDAGGAAPRVGEVLPPFLLPEDRGHLISLEDLVQQAPVALTFHRGHWCPYCRINTSALARAHAELHDTGGQVVAIVPDRQEFATEFKSEAGASFPVLTDLDNAYAMSLNLAIWIGVELKQMIASAGFDLSAYQGNDSWIVPIPATFVVGTDGVITARFVDPDYRRRMAIEELLAALRATH
jgi:peroxiredoxin